MNNWHKKKRLTEQLKFFGAKKLKFISCYAKKPRIVMKVKTVTALNPATRLAQQRQLSALHSQQLGMGIFGSSLGLQQMASMNTAQASINQQLRMRGQLGGLVGGAVSNLLGGSFR